MLLYGCRRKVIIAQKSWLVKKHFSLRSILAGNLREMRLLRKLSQEKLAELSGLHRTYVGSVERGERNISIDNIEALSAALGVSPSALMERKKPK
jgi:transcriptional regulator with XRE-family HTH domain